MEHEKKKQDIPMQKVVLRLYTTKSKVPLL